MSPRSRFLAILALSLSTLVPVGLHGADDYTLSRESLERAAGVPAGKVQEFDFNDSKVFPGTTRGCWLYIPAQYDGRSRRP